MPGRLPRNIKTVDVRRAFTAAARYGQDWVASTDGREAFVMRWAGRTVSIPEHPRDMPIGTLRSIIRQAGWSIDEFRYLAGLMTAGEQRQWLMQNPDWQ